MKQQTNAKNVFIISLLRRPLVSLLLLLAIGFVSFGFVGKAVEAVIVNRETQRLEGYYRSIGYLERIADADARPLNEAAKLIGQSPYIAYGDLMRQTGGFMEGIYNTDYHTGTMDSVGHTHEGQGVRNLEYWFYGTLISFDTKYRTDENGNEVLGAYLLNFKVDEVVAGYPEKIKAGSNYAIWIPVRFMPNFDQLDPYVKQMQVNQRYLMHASNDLNFIHGATPDNPFVNTRGMFKIESLEGDDLWYLEANKNIDLDLPQYLNLKNEIDRLNLNLHSIMLYGTSDMSAMPEVQESAMLYYLVDGRWLNHKDEIEDNKVIVISSQLSKIRKLKVGDSITFTFLALKDPYWSYLRNPEDVANWRTYPRKNVSYEIVGVYSDPGMDKEVFQDNTSTISFIPNIGIPDEFIFPTRWNNYLERHLRYSFVLTDPSYQGVIIQEYGPKLEELGYRLKFVDNEGANFMAVVVPLRKSISIGLILYSLALLVAIGLAIFLYYKRQNKNYAILRALGNPKKICNLQIFFPMLGIGFIGSVLGAAFSWKYALGSSAISLSKIPLPSGVYPDTSLSIGWLIILWGLVFVLFLLILLAGIRQISQKTVLAALQSGGELIHSIKEIEPAISGKSTPTLKMQPLNERSVTTNIHRKKQSRNALINYGKSTILRSALRTILTIILSAGLVLAIGWFQSLIVANKSEIDSLYSNIQIRVDILSKTTDGNPIKNDLVNTILATGNFHSENLSTSRNIANVWLPEEEKYLPTIMLGLGLNNLEGCMQSYLLDTTLIDYKPDFDKALFTKDWSEIDLESEIPPIIVPQAILDQMGSQVGEKIKIWFYGANTSSVFEVVGASTGGRLFYGGGSSFPINATGPFLYPQSVAEKDSKLPLDYLEASFSLDTKRNRDIDLVKRELNMLLLPDLKDGTEIPTIKFWDEELTAVVEPLEKNLDLMEMLFPIAIAVATLLGIILSFILVFNQAKEAALLRMMGVSLQKTRSLQISQVLLLSLFGGIVGILLVGAIRGVSTVRTPLLTATAIYYCGVFFGSLIASLVNTNRKPMELLQVKE